MTSSYPDILLPLEKNERMEEPQSVPSQENEFGATKTQDSDYQTAAEPDLLVGHTIMATSTESSDAAAVDVDNARDVADSTAVDVDNPRDSLQKSTDSLQEVGNGQDDLQTPGKNSTRRDSHDDLNNSRRTPDELNDSVSALKLSRSNLSGKDSSSPSLSPRERDRVEKIRGMREKQQREQEKKVEELREANRIAQEHRDRQLEERRKRLEEIRRRDDERRKAVEERRRQAEDADRERRHILLKKQAEREQKFEIMRVQFRRDSRPLAFGSRTPREVCVVEYPMRRTPSLSQFNNMPKHIKKRLSRSVPPRPHSCCFPQDQQRLVNDSPPRRPRPRSSLAAPVMSSSLVVDSPIQSTTSDRRGRSTQRSSTFTSRSKSQGSEKVARTPPVVEKKERKTPTPRASLHPSEQLSSPRQAPNSPRQAPNSPRERPERPPSRGPVKATQPTAKKTEKPEKPKTKPTSEVKPKSTPEQKPKSKPKQPEAAGAKSQDKAEPTPEELEYKAKLAEKRRQAREEAARRADEEAEKKLETVEVTRPTSDEEVEELNLEAEKEVVEEVDEETIREAERIADEARLAEEQRLQKAIEEEEERKRQEADRLEEERIKKEEEERQAREEQERLEREKEEKAKKEEVERSERKRRLEMIMKRVKNDSSPVPRATSPATDPELGRVVDTAMIENVRNLKSPEPEKFKSAYLQSIMMKRQQNQTASGDTIQSSGEPEENGPDASQTGDQSEKNGAPVSPDDTIMKPVADENESQNESESSLDSPSVDPSEQNLEQVIQLDNQVNLTQTNGNLDIINFNEQPTTMLAFEESSATNQAQINSVNEVEVS